MNNRRNPSQGNHFDKVFLVSFPKSGNTWMRFLLGTLLSNEKVDWKNINQYVFEIGTRPIAPIKHFNHVQYFKSHSYYDPSFQKVIYMVRDVRDVVISYYYYLLKRNVLIDRVKLNEFIPQFIKGDFDSFKWDEHVKSWLRNSHKIANGFHLVKYEDLQKQPIVEMKKIMSFLNVDVNDEKIIDALNWSSFRNMRALEIEQQNYSYMLRKSNKAIPFIRSGKVGEWKTELDQDQQELLKQAYGQTLIDLGYETSLDW
ncbi:sulfotransferase domain-containing protein [Fictibacillus phosphorivorans]|uniref:sulfotransferase domain-containing protein n=1 Tax=Fictibacillus phosphorivorans TaxID=1221500 RepID=UPI00203D5DCE|nr:sulfotransferase domain-containing protein [Fictibacillus phosphorivorans]MCM3719144.1 sulfotransferase domain-containing protein [Fictibacillus phosphorivorans]MCM3776766.1 sulfotransferase domain-containing protein [Fictibacillus phosphorivorans]